MKPLCAIGMLPAEQTCRIGHVQNNTNTSPSDGGTQVHVLWKCSYYLLLSWTSIM